MRDNQLDIEKAGCNTEKEQQDSHSRIARLRDLMRKNDIDVYVVPTDDFHLSEYVGDYFKTREYMSGFTGSAGTLVVTQEKAGLWTDGRYYIQAESQLKSSVICLYKDGMEGVPSVKQYLKEQLKSLNTLGFDGRCMTAELGESYESFCKNIEYTQDLVGECWNNRPTISKMPAYILPIKYSGESYQEKIQRVRKKMEAAEADYFLLAALDEIAWLLNIRGNDVAYNPVMLSYLLISKEEVILYSFQESCAGIAAYLQENGIIIRDYYQVYEDAKLLQPGTKVLIDKKKLNYTFYKNLQKAGCSLVEQENPTYLFKAIKNEVEAKNEKLAHVKDGVAYVRFLKWFKENIGNIPMDELSVANRLREEREGMEHFVEESFESISAYGAHGAIVHYAANEETNQAILPEGFLLLDTGGHYLEGTTDITRTLVCGKLTKEEKQLYTAALRGNLQLGAAVFMKGINGCNLDILARQPLWELGFDYKHGTGHGVGYLLNVHEGPQNIRWRMNGTNPPIEPGMIVSNEPGVYIEGAFGIRLENLLLCRKREHAVKEECSLSIWRNLSQDTFLEWETLTLVPFEREAILPEMLTERERNCLNEYHQRIYQELSPYLTLEEAKFLRGYTEKI